MATTLGSRKTMPFSLEKTSVLAVPRSIPISLESKPNTVIRWLRKLLKKKVYYVLVGFYQMSNHKGGSEKLSCDEISKLR